MVWLVICLQKKTNSGHPYLICHVSEVHLGSVVAPGPEYEPTALLIKRVVGNVDLTHCLEHSAWLPVHQSVRTDDSTELAVITIDSVSAEKWH